MAKHPRVDRWQEQATTDSIQIRKWFEQWPDANLGIVTGDGLLVLDVDGYNGGEDSIGTVFAKYGRPETLQVLSGSGSGTHYYFDCSDLNLRCRCSLWRGVDVRGMGGYVVAPPSTHESGDRYVWDGLKGIDAPIASVPDWLVTAINGDGNVASDKVDFVVDSQAQPPAEKFERLLLTSDKFSQSWYKTRTDLRDRSASGYDLSVATCAALDGWTPQEIVDLVVARRQKHNDELKPIRYFERTVELAMKAGGTKRPTIINEPRLRSHSTKGGRIVNAADLMAREFPPIRWYAESVLHEGAAILSGDPKAGKSFFALQLACAVAGGYDFVFGDIPVDVEGRVLYVSADDGSERRFKDRLVSVACTPEAAQRIDFMWPEDIPSIQEGLPNTLKTRLDRQADPYVLVIVDTFGAVNMPKTNGNVYTNEYAAMRPFQEIATEYRICVLLLHHTNKDRANRGEAISSASGSHGVTGAVDSVLLLQRDDKDQNGATLFGRSRDGGDVQLKLHRRAQGGWECVDAAPESKKPTNAEAEVLALLSGSNPITKEQLASALGIEVETARKRLGRMASRGRLVKLPGGQYAIPVEDRAA